jgi:myo-inositol-1(or 4)-monophosphatase
MTGTVEVARDLAARAGEVLRSHFGRLRAVHHKSEVDLVTAADRDAEALLVDGLARAFPGHRVVAEESGERGADSDRVWYVDPLDGTTNFVHGIPHFAVSLGLVVDGSPAMGVVHDPLRQETFLASHGHGATLNGAPVHVSAPATIQAGLIGTGFPYDRRHSAGRYLPAFERVLRASRDVRRAGSAALDLAWVACGRLDGYWEFGLRPWDTAAGTLLVREAGGLVTACDGSEDPLPYAAILACNPTIHRALRDLVCASEFP